MRCIGFVFAVGMSVGVAYADLPVIDGTEIAQTVAMLNQLKTQYQTLVQQYQQLRQQYQSITGQYGWGMWKNGIDELRHARQWAASTWQEALHGLSGGNPERYAELLKQYQQDHPALASDHYQAGADAALAQSYQNQVQVNQASAAQSAYEINDLNQHQENLFELGKAIENSAHNPGLKSAVDLNSRIALEAGYLQVEQLRMQALMNQQMNQIQASQIAQETEAAEFNQGGEK